jgi:hypothetical protein
MKNRIKDYIKGKYKIEFKDGIKKRENLSFQVIQAGYIEHLKKEGWRVIAIYFIPQPERIY